MQLYNTNTYFKMHPLYLLALFAVTLFASCGTNQNAAYFTNIADTTLRANTPLPESRIQKNDLLSISVSSLNPEATVIYNSPNAVAGIPGSSGAAISGYLVNSDGNIQFPVLGNIKAEGLTKDQLRDNIRKSLEDKKLLVDPIVMVRFLNYRVTVLGEVGRPSVINVPSEKISLLEAIGMAGDLTIFGKRENVLVIREEENGQKTMKRLNLNSNELLTSPYYYLKSNDIVYVEPSKAKVNTTSSTRVWLPVIFSGVSMIAVVFQRLFR